MMVWNVSFARNSNDWELDSVTSFLGLLQSHIPSRGADDGLRWNLKQNGIFDVRSFYTALRVLPNVDFPWKSIWHKKAPRRACFFVWTEATIYLIGVACVALMVKLLITFFYIVLWRMSYGVGASRLLGSNGSYLGPLLICYLVGGMG
jgi:hypothetical protein